MKSLDYNTRHPGRHTQSLAPETRRAVLGVQRTEATEAQIYQTLSRLTKSSDNSRVLATIASTEQEHANFWSAKTGARVEPNRFKAWTVVSLARVLGLTFVLKRMERGENTASRNYQTLAARFPEAAAISKEEDEHEQELFCMLDEKWLSYAGSIVLGLNDALVELTGALAGFTLALSDSRVISLAGLVTGISAALSMGTSAYLSLPVRGQRSALQNSFLGDGRHQPERGGNLVPYRVGAQGPPRSRCLGDRTVPSS